LKKKSIKQNIKEKSMPSIYFFIFFLNRSIGVVQSRKTYKGRGLLREKEIAHGSGPKEAFRNKWGK
jgi:hypothetical protein